MKNFAEQAVRVVVTTAAVAVALLVAWQLWRYYFDLPWTRDGRVKADVVQIAPDVSGFIADVAVQDNQHVKAGDTLFTIDRARYELSLRDATAALDMRRAQLAQAQRELERLTGLQKVSAVSASAAETQALDAAVAGANLAAAEADLDTAKLNLERTVIRAPLDGIVTNFSLRRGNYAVAGKSVFALVSADSYYVMGYFEETKLPRIHVGDRARVQLMGSKEVLEGRVESYALGIFDRERADSADMLANVNPTFSWIRLAQRIPVRIALDPLPADVKLISGQTASVTILPGERDKDSQAEGFSKEKQ